MKKNPIYESLIDKSIGSMLSAIEIYNKPDFKYREETFAILAINSWELLLKARLLKLNSYRINSIYCYKPYINKNGEKSKKKKVLDRNRTNNPKSISIYEALNRLNSLHELPSKLKDNIEALIEFRDNAIHFINMKDLLKPLQELGFACIKNYVQVLKDWQTKRSLSKYNLYLMPLAYVDNKIDVDSASSPEAQNFIQLIKHKLENENKGEEYDIAIKIELKFQKGNSFTSTNVKYDENGIPVTMSEEDIRKRYPFTYKEVIDKAKNRYSDFKCGTKFNNIMKSVKQNVKLYYERKLDSKNPKSQKQGFYSPNIWQVLDNHYSRDRI